jgi:hypothetical protein
VTSHGGGKIGITSAISTCSKTYLAALGPQGSFVGLDQVNVQLPPAVKGKGNVLVQLTANGIQLQFGPWVKIPGSAIEIEVSPDPGVPWIVHSLQPIFR